MLGILLIHKRAGCTSHDVIRDLRRRLGLKRIGHAGTLDPLATGLLVVAVGTATRFLQYLSLEPKEYIAEIQFGAETETYDAEGEPKPIADPPKNLKTALEKAIPSFTGLIRQIPPKYSAVKRQGRPLYAYARAGEDVDPPEREVLIQKIEVLETTEDTATLKVAGSTGFYVRSLAHDLGQALACGAYLKALTRTRAGVFELRNAVPVEEAGPQHLIPLRNALEPIPALDLDPAQVEDVRQGRTLILPETPNSEELALCDPSGHVFALGRVAGNRVHPECVIPRGPALDHV